jgi:hypothetical protein
LILHRLLDVVREDVAILEEFRRVPFHFIEEMKPF